MGFLRGFSKGIVGIIFLLLLTGLIANIAFYALTQPESIKPIFSQAIMQSFQGNQLDLIYNDAATKCKSQQQYLLPMENSTITIDCSQITSKDSFVSAISDSIFSQVYERPCSDIQCLQLTDFPGFITASFNSFLYNTMIAFAVISAVLGLLLFVLSAGWSSKFISLGTPLALTGLTYFGFNLPGLISMMGISSGIEAAMISRLGSVLSVPLLAFLISGAAMIVIGIIIGIGAMTKKAKKPASKSKKSKKRNKRR